MKKIVLTGGGTAGHVTPNLALVPGLRELGYSILYIGSTGGMEKDLVEKAGLSYRGISSGKLRRYFDFKNFTDPFRVIKGCFEARGILKKYVPDVVFSKGGFVAVPVTIAAFSLGIPVVAHESDMTPGLANKIASPFVKRICCNFPETLGSLPAGKGVLTGSPIRGEILTGSRDEGLRLLGFGGDKPVLLIIGGSLGAQHINDMVRKVLDLLLAEFDIVHICGKGNLDASLSEKAGYRQFEFVDKELKDYFAAADIFISRAGANAISEILALKKPNLLIPLSLSASRGDQILNAGSFEKQGFSKVLKEEDMTEEFFMEAVISLYKERDYYIKNMDMASQTGGTDAIIGVIEETVR